MSNAHLLNLLPMTWKRRIARMALLYLLTPYLVVMAMMILFQRRLLFQPTKTERLLAHGIVAEAQIEDVEIPAERGLILHGWLFHADQTEANTPRSLVMYLPGNAGCRRDRIADCRDFTQLGCDVLLFDYRGYGDNGGSPSEERLISDAHRIWRFATGELRIGPEKIILFGESLGGAVAIRLAAESSQVGTPPGALVLNSTFASLGDTVAWHYPVFPFRYFLWDAFPSVRRIPRVACPVLQFHGTADDIVPIEHGRQLFAAAPPQSNSGITNRFVTIDGGQHNFITVGMVHSEIRALLQELGDNSSEPARREIDE